MKNMKKLGLLIIVVLLLTACGTDTPSVVDNDTKVSEVGTTGVQREELRGDYADDALSPALQLVVGTLMMEETDLALDADLAATLLPYWKLYISLTGSDITAREELDGLVNEIEHLMTPDQINYIIGLELTQESMMTLIDELGVMDKLKADGASEGDGTGFSRPDGMPEGVGPGGGQGRAGGSTEGMDPELVATMQARKAEEGGGLFGANRFIVPLIEELIIQLEAKIG